MSCGRARCEAPDECSRPNLEFVVLAEGNDISGAGDDVAGGAVHPIGLDGDRRVQSALGQDNDRGRLSLINFLCRDTEGKQP